MLKPKSRETAHRVKRLQVFVIFELASGKTLNSYPEILLPDSMSVVRNLRRQKQNMLIISTANPST